ncbi:MAG: hypothetical protein GY694_18075 [Gammaproteobacteria bacterium]|nr:hypothetical protein [Gammaproteobacteria bacterium]
MSAIKSQGTALTIDATAIGNIVSYDGFDGAAQEIDITNLASTAKEYEVGLVDNGNFGFEVNVDDSDAGQAALTAAKNAGTTDTYVLTLTGGDTRTFDALVVSFSESAGVDDVVKGSVQLKISGSVVKG